MSLPLFATSRAASRTITWGDYAVAMLIGFALPVAIGAVLFMLGALPFMGENGSVIAGVGGFLLFTPLISWAGLIPGAVVLFVLLRLGWGGLAPAVLVGAAIGTAIATILGSAFGFTVFTLFGAGFAALAWGALRRRRPDALVRPGQD